MAGVTFPKQPATNIGSYSSKVAFIYVFNLIVGAGALALPKAFAMTGWILGLVTLSILAFMSFVTTTFMIEAMAIANAIANARAAKGAKLAKTESIVQRDPSSISSEDSTGGPAEDTHLLINSPQHGSAPDMYDITRKYEMGQMAHMFYNRVGVVLYYIIISLYLYGDLAIYAAAVPKSLARVTCVNLKSLHNSTHKSVQSAPCLKGLTTTDVYRLYLLVFTVLLGPFVFFNIQKTKYLQLLTTVTRWIAFILMIVLALVKIVKGDGHKGQVINFEHLPSFFGVSVYSFMCQHSLPSILTPVQNKNKLTSVLAGDFTMVLLFYVLVLMTSVFTFSAADIQDLYTLNFVHAWPGFAYFLVLFPVFTLSSSFPIIGITLRENLKSMVLKEGKSYHFIVERIVFPVATVLPPVLVAFATTDVEELVNVTGSYAGAFIQYVIPVMFVYCGRKKARRYFGLYANKHRSVFRQKSWIFFVIFWAGACIALVTAYNIKSLVNSAQKA